MKLYLIRHPQTKRNVNRKLTGWENSHYSEEGKKQFERILDFFIQNKIKYPVYSSDLPRALRLGKVIAKECGLKLHINKLLRERNFKETKPYEHYETEIEFKKRISKFFSDNPIKEGIIVSHSGVIKEIIKKFSGKEFLKNLKLKRDYIFLIETIKNKKNFQIIKV